MKYPWMQWFATDWLNDPQVSVCEPATRGILMDWLCNMHLLDRCGQITGSREQLARLGRCTSVQVESALTDLIATKAADVTFRNDVVTVVNRRMKREYLARKNGAIRVSRHRGNVACNAPVTPHSHKSESESKKNRESQKPAPLPLALVFDAWNALGVVPQCLVVSDKRRRLLEIRLREPFFAANWQKAMEKIKTSKFCQGDNDRGWKASFDWLLQPDTCAKIMEGKYDRTSNHQRTSPENSRNAHTCKPVSDYARAAELRQRVQAQEREARNSPDQVGGEVSEDGSSPPETA